MYCKKCGKGIDNDSRYCVYCGAEQSPMQEVPDVFGEEKESKPKAPVSKKLKAIVSVILAAVLVFGSVAVVFTYFSAASIAERYAKAGIEGNMRQMISYGAVGKDFYLVSDNNNIKISESLFFDAAGEELECDINSWSQLYKAYRQVQKDELMDEYGKYKITADAVKVKNISLKKFKNDNAKLLETYEEKGSNYFNVNKVSKVKMVTVNIKIAGEDVIERGTLTMYMVKSGLTWKVFNQNYSMSSFLSEVNEMAPAAEAPAAEAPAAEAPAEEAAPAKK